MAKVLISDQYLTDIGNAIRSKNGLSNTYTPAQMAAAITAIPTGGGGTDLSTYKTIYFSYDAPLASQGNDGDIFIVVERR